MKSSPLSWQTSCSWVVGGLRLRGWRDERGEARLCSAPSSSRRFVWLRLFVPGGNLVYLGTIVICLIVSRLSKGRETELGSRMFQRVKYKEKRPRRRVLVRLSLVRVAGPNQDHRKQETRGPLCICRWADYPVRSLSSGSHSQPRNACPGGPMSLQRELNPTCIMQKGI